MVTDSGDLDSDHHFYNSNTNQACNYLLVDDFNLKYPGAYILILTRGV